MQEPVKLKAFGMLNVLVDGWVRLLMPTTYCMLVLIYQVLPTRE